MAAVDELKETNTAHVRKWGTQILALADYSEAPPATFFDVEGAPVLPAAFRQLGFITTDGITQAKSVSSESVSMVQQLEPVRTDITGIEQSLTCTFGESSSAWVNALVHAWPVADWAADPHSAWEFFDGDVTDYPYYRLMVIAQDGTGDDAFYRVEFGYRAKVTALTDRSLQRANSEGFGVTFGLFKDPEVGRILGRAENGPGFTASVPAP